MKAHTSRFLSIIAVAIWFTTSTVTALAATASITASATIATATLAPIPQSGLDFGTISVGNTGADILIDASSGSSAPQVTSGTAAVTNGNSGLVEVESSVDATVTITYAIEDNTTAGTADQIADSSGNSIPLTAASIATYSTGSTLALTAGTPSDINVGGVLQIGTSQAPGNYEGTITVTVSY